MQGQTADEPHDEFPVRNAKLSAADVGKATLKKSKQIELTVHISCYWGLCVNFSFIKPAQR